jgi:glycosyltransferase involved in cell wall biosynthesis
MIGRGIYTFLETQGHQLITVSRLRSRWIYWKPLQLLRARLLQQRIGARLCREPVDLWLTYHSYYKAPDILGPQVCARARIPYVIIQPSFGTRVSRSWKTRPGYRLNRKALLAADALITDRSRDYTNLQRIVPTTVLYRIKPGLDPALFTFSHDGRRRLRRKWQTGTRPVILAAAMFRSDVKTRSIIRLLKSCLRIRGHGLDFQLVLVGDGPEKNNIAALAAQLPDDTVLFAGKIDRSRMADFYSAADIFAFPGINESLGMVFLEAQSCGLPVIACNNGGIPEVVHDSVTGLLTPLEDPAAFDRALVQLLTHPQQRKDMGRAAAEYVRQEHDSNTNYLQMEQILVQTAADSQ